METCCEYTDSVMWVSTDERRMITRMMKLIAEHPDETEIIQAPRRRTTAAFTAKCRQRG